MTAKDLELTLYKNNIIFSFSGTISYNTLSAISISIKDELNNKEGTSKELFNVYYVFIEMIQNIMNYSVSRDDDGDTGSGTCFVTYDKVTQKFKVCSGNIILPEQAAKISNRIDKINSLDSDELKKHYKEIRKSGKDAHDKGGGLGFIEIARKTSGKLNYSITKINSEKSYFDVCVEI